MRFEKELFIAQIRGAEKSYTFREKNKQNQMICRQHLFYKMFN